MSRHQKDDLVYRALADYRRRAILDLLTERPQTTGQICKHFKKLDRCTVMQHLGVLERADLIIVKREGRYRWNYLNVVPIKNIHDRWINPYVSRSAELLARFKAAIES